MKKLLLFFLMLAVTLVTSSTLTAQISTYSFSQSSGTYTPVTGGTSIIAAATDDGSSAATNIGFTFNFGGTNFTQFVANSNGSIRFGSSAPTSSYSPISTASNSFAIAGCAIDGRNGGAVVYSLTGTTPSQVLTIEYPDFNLTYAAAGTSNTQSFQIKLYETTNVVEIVYGTSAANASYTAQVGLRGSTTASDFRNRTTTTDWSATTAGVQASTMTWSTSVRPASGLIYSWAPPSCVAPSGLTNLLTSSSSANHSWSAAVPAPGTGYQWAVTTSATPPASGTATAGLTASSTGLTPNTTYYLHVRSDCGASTYSSWATSNFYTGYCNPAPSSVDASGITNVTFGASPNIVNNTTGTETNNYGNYSAQIGDGAQGTTLNVNITFSTGYTYGTKIWIDWNNDLDFDDAGELMYTGLSASPNPSTLNASFTVPLAAALGNYRMRIGGTDTDTGPSSPCYTGTYGSFEDYTLNVTPAPACSQPTALAISSITSTSAQASWTTGGAVVWVMEYGPTGFAHGAGTIVTTATNPETLTLTPATTYDFYVRDFCSVGDSSAWSGPVTFTTLCSSLSVPWTETFETSSTTEVCWTVNNVNADADLWNLNYASNAYAGSQSANIYTDNNSGANDDWLISPATVLSGNQRLKYWYRVQSAGEPNDFELLLSTTGTAPADFSTTLIANTAYSNTTYMEEIVDLSAYSGTVYLAWHVPNGGLDGWRLYIDEVTVEDIPTCIVPTGLNASNITATSADLNWTASATAGATYNWEVQPTGIAQGTAGTIASGTGVVGTMVNTGATLSAGTTYDFFVQSDCGGSGPSTWSTASTFTTPIANDDCAGAIPLTVNTDGTCTTTGTFLNTGATFSTAEGAPSATCSDNDPAPLDIWFSAVVPASGELTFQFLSNFGFSTIVELYTGTCGSLTALAPVNCTNTGSRLFTGLTPASTVYFRVWDYGSDDFGSAEICVKGLNCSGPTLTTTVIDDCANSQFSIELNVTNMGTATSYDVQVAATSVGTITGTGTVTVGPFANGTAVDLDLIHNVDNACDETLTGFLNGICPTIIPCGSTVNTSGVCYSDGIIEEWFFESSNGNALNITVNAGQVENNYDEFQVYDGADATATLIYSGYGTSGDLTGLTFNSSGSEMYIRITPDGSTSCATDAYTNLNFDISCLACSGPVVSYTVVPDCANNQFSVDVNVTNMGSATSYNLQLGGSSIGTISATGTTTYGPYANGSVNDYTLVHNVDITCNLSQTGITYICPPANDDCATPIALTVNANLLCGAVTPGTITAATASAQANGCSGNADDDVWFSFVATATAHRVSLLNVTGSVTDMFHSVYAAAPGCGALASALVCSDADLSTVSGLTIGATYLVRVYTYTSTAGQTVNFNVCIGTPPPPPANDDCLGAYVATVNPDYNCGSVTSATFLSATNSVDAESCSGAFGSDLWFKFTATATSHRITTINTSAYVDFNYQVLDGCGGTSLLCQDSPNNQIDLTGLTIGNNYIIRVGAYSSTYTSSVTFDFCVGTPPPPPANDDLCNATLLVVDAAPTTGTNVSATGQLNEPNGSCWFSTATQNSVWFSFVATATDHKVTSDFVGVGLTDDHLAVYNGLGNCADMTTLGTQIGCSEDNGVLGSGYNGIILLSSLTIGNTYYIQLDGYGTATGTYKIQVTTLPPAGSFVWTGASSTSWTATGNWAGGVAPTVCADNVFIQSSGYNPNLTANFTCGNLETQAGAAMTIASGSSLTVCGNMDLKSGTTINGSVVLDGTNIAVTGNATVGKLTANAATTMSSGTLNISEGLVLNNTFTNSGTVVLKSIATGTAYLDDFTNSSASYAGNLEVEMFVTTGGDALGQRFFGSAVSGSSAAGLNMTYATGYPMGQLVPDVCGTSLLWSSPYSNLFSWNQAATLLAGCEFSAWTAIPGSSVLTPGRGYSGWMNDNSIVKVSGTPNTGNVSFALSANNTSGNAVVDGWHLVSNPYPSPIAVNALILSGLTSPTIYNGDAAYYGTFTSALLAGNLASMQGLYAKNTTGAANFTVANTSRVASNAVVWKSSATMFDQMLTIDVKGNGFADKTYLYYSDDAVITNGFDAYGDSEKKNSFTGQPTIYTSLNNERMALNGYPVSSIGQSVPMGVEHGANGSFELEFDGLTNFPANTTIYVEDKQEGVYHNIANGNYAYTALATDNSDRFEIHFVLPIELATVNVNCAGDLGAIELVSTAGLSDRDFTISNATNVLSTGALASLNTPVAAGLYTVTVSDAFGGNQVYTVEVAQDEAIVADYSVSTLEAQVGEIVSFNNLTANATNVEWNIANLATINGVNNATFSFNTAGAYEVVMNVSNADCSDSKAFTVNVSNKTTSVTTLGADNLVQVYSDKNVVTIAFENTFKANASVAIQNVLGQKVFDGTVNANGEQRINLGEVSTGYYFVSINVEGKSFTSKVYIAQK